MPYGIGSKRPTDMLDTKNTPKKYQYQKKRVEGYIYPPIVMAAE